MLATNFICPSLYFPFIPAEQLSFVLYPTCPEKFKDKDAGVILAYPQASQNKTFIQAIASTLAAHSTLNSPPIEPYSHSSEVQFEFLGTPY
jgi:hypothetical protein